MHDVTALRATAATEPSPRFLGLAVMLLGLALALDNFGLFELALPLPASGRWPDRGRRSRGSCAAPRRERPRRTGLVMRRVGAPAPARYLGLLQFRQASGRSSCSRVGGVHGLARRPDARTGGETAADVGHRALDAFALLGGVQRGLARHRTSAAAARRRRMGGCEIDLRQASMPRGRDGGARRLRVHGAASRCGCPRTGRWRPAAWPCSAASRTRRAGPLDDRKKLVVTGLAVMGGVEVKN